MSTIEKTSKSMQAVHDTITQFKDHYGLDMSDIIHDRGLSARQKLAKLKPMLHAAIEKKLGLPANSLAKQEADAAPAGYAYAPESLPVMWIGDDVYNTLYATYGTDIPTQVNNLHATFLATSQMTEGAMIGTSLAGAGIVGIGLGVAGPIYLATQLGTMSLAYGMPLILGAMSVPLIGLVLVGITLLTVGLTLIIMSILDDYNMMGLIVNGTSWDLNMANYPLGNNYETGNGLYFSATGGLVACMNEVLDDGSQVNLPAMYTAMVAGASTAFYPVGIWQTQTSKLTGTEGMMIFGSPAMTEDAILGFCNYQGFGQNNPAAVGAEVKPKGQVTGNGGANWYFLMQNGSY